MIRIQELTFRYPGSTTPAIDQLSLHIRDGLLYGLLGPNGSGKTTLISLIMGLLQPTAGSLTVNAQPRGEDRPRAAFVPQEYAFYSRLSVAENLRFFAGVGASAPRPRSERIEAAIEATALGEFLHVRAERLSGGLKRRLNLAIGLVGDPQLLLLDEPTVGIDPHSRHFILESIRAIHQAGTTVVYTSHYMEEVESLCDEIGVLDHGHLIAQGSLHELLGRGDEGALHVTVHDPVDGAWLAERKHARLTNGALLVARCPATAVAGILADLHAQGVRFSRMRYAEQNLEDLFLQLTGRQLRD